MNSKVFLKAAEVQDKQNRKNPNGLNFSCWNIEVVQGNGIYNRSCEREFYQSLFDLEESIFNDMAGGLSRPEVNDIRVLALLMAYWISQ